MKKSGITYFFRAILASFLFFATSTLQAQDFPGGFIEQVWDAQARPTFSRQDLANLLPNQGKFTFPPPYNTEAVRLTNADDCNGADCLWYVGYSYWRNINNHVDSDTMLIFLSLDRRSGGGGPTLLEYDKTTDQLIGKSPLFDSSSNFSYATGEGWYFSGTMPTKLYMLSGSRLMRYDVISRDFETVFDVNSYFGGGYSLWQAHSSTDDRVHSATVRSGGDRGCIVYKEGIAEFQYFPKTGSFDECQVDKSGRWLLIKENVNGSEGEDNRIIDLVTGNERYLDDKAGAAGHSDMGYGYMVASDNWANNANTQKVWDFNNDSLRGVTAYYNNDWGVQAPAHLSHTNAQNLPPEDQYACGSSANSSNSLHANEIICFRLDSTGDVLVVAPVMTDKGASGGGDSYQQAPKGNLDVTGRYFIWTSNIGSDRLDAFLVKVPGQLLTGSNNIPDNNTTDNGTPEPSVPPQDTTAPIISNVSIANLTESTATINWSSNEPAESAVEYGINNSYGNMSEWNTTAATNHGFTLSGLNPGTAYHYRLFNQDAAGNIATSADYTFTTASAPAPTTPEDITAPMITDISVQGITAFSATINWITDEASESAVEYGIDESYGSITNLDTQFDTAHQFSLTGLSPDTVYHYRAYNRDAAGNIGSSEDRTFSTLPQSIPNGDAAGVVWTDVVNIDVTGTTLTKIAGCDGCGDAGAVSSQAIMEGNGYLEFTATDTGPMLFAGLADGSSNLRSNKIDFALRLQSATAEVRENGKYRGDVKFSAGDRFRIQVEDQRVSYLKNGSVFYSSANSTSNPLLANTIFYNINASISDVIISSIVASEPETPADTGSDTGADTGSDTGADTGSDTGANTGSDSNTDTGSASEPEAPADTGTDGSTDTASGSDAAGDEPTGPRSVVWYELVNVQVTGDSLTKSGGCDGCSDAGAASVQQIKDGNGYLEFTIPETSPMLFAGLNSDHNGTKGNEIDYAIRLQAGYAEVRENGVYKYDVRFSAGDLFRIQVENGRVTYARNGTVFYSSGITTDQPLRADTALYNSNAAIQNAQIKIGD